MEAYKRVSLQFEDFNLHQALKAQNNTEHSIG